LLIAPVSSSRVKVMLEPAGSVIDGGGPIDRVPEMLYVCVEVAAPATPPNSATAPRHRAATAIAGATRERDDDVRCSGTHGP
jgi:hypothetical protein